MSNEIWDHFIPDDDKLVYKAAGYGEKGGPGNNPALLIVDVTYGFTGREPLPVLDSVKAYPNACGYFAWDALKYIRLLIERARSLDVPIYYTAGVEGTSQFAGRWRDKHPRAAHQPPDADTIVDDISPEAGDFVIRKTKPSAFFGTPLLASLIGRHIDTVIIAGCTTSGCVRATVLDSFSYNLATIVAQEAVFDRGRVSHAINLFEMDQKYADILSVNEIMAYLDQVRA